MPRFEMKPDLNLRSVSLSRGVKQEILDRVSMVGDNERPVTSFVLQKLGRVYINLM